MVPRGLNALNQVQRNALVDQWTGFLGSLSVSQGHFLCFQMQCGSWLLCRVQPIFSSVLNQNFFIMNAMPRCLPGHRGSRGEKKKALSEQSSVLPPDICLTNRWWLLKSYELLLNRSSQPAFLCSIPLFQDNPNVAPCLVYQGQTGKNTLTPPDCSVSTHSTCGSWQSERQKDIITEMFPSKCWP